MNLRRLFKKRCGDCSDGQEDDYDVGSGKADIHPLSKVFVFVPMALVLSCLAIVVAVFIAPMAMDFVKNKLESINVYVAGNQSESNKELNIPFNSSLNDELKAAPPEILFSDVNDYSEYFQSLTYLKNHGVVLGYLDGSIRPDVEIKRAEFVKTLVLAKKQFPLALNYNTCFKDVGTEWFAPSVCFAKSGGWIKGFEDGTFRPGEKMSKEDVKKLLVKAFDLELYPEDVPDEIEPGGESPITRGEAFKMLYHVLQI